MNDLVTITAALADPGRVRVLAALRGAGEVCACHVIELLALAPSTVSKHMEVLRRAGLVEARKEGRWMHYRVARAGPPAVRGALEWLWASLGGDPQVRADAQRMRAILGMDAEALCCQQREKGPGAAVPVCGPACCSSAPATRAAARWPRAGRGRSRAT